MYSWRHCDTLHTLFKIDFLHNLRLRYELRIILYCYYGKIYFSSYASKYALLFRRYGKRFSTVPYPSWYNLLYNWRISRPWNDKRSYRGTKTWEEKLDLRFEPCGSILVRSVHCLPFSQENWSSVINNKICLYLLLVLGHHKTLFIPDIVGPVLEMTLIPETGNTFASLFSHMGRIVF